MKDKKIIFILFIFKVFNCHAFDFEEQEYVFTAFYDDLLNPPFIFSFKNSYFSLSVPELDLEKLEELDLIKGYITGNYILKTENTFLYAIAGNKKYLVLYYKNLICVLIDCENNHTYFGINKNSEYVHIGNRVFDNYLRLIGGIGSSQKTSSNLTERIDGKEIVYNGKDNYYYQLTKPWVEGKNDYGINEWIEKRIASKTKKIIFFNGFINPKRPDLFFNNTRVKNITVTAGNKSWSFLLKDDPNPQILELPEYITGIIRFTIKDVYKGDKYADTSIAGIYFLIDN
jgi:hypothetical protein